VPRSAVRQAREANRAENNPDGKNPARARTRRALEIEGASRVAIGPEMFGAFATTEFAKDMQRARWDVDFFCERFLGFTPHPGQSMLFRLYLKRDESRWMARYLTLCIAAGNRAGKTLGLAVVVIHATLFKMGKKPPNPMSDNDVKRWIKQQYEWYHFGVHTEVAELLYHEIVKLLGGTHEAQKAGCPLADLLGMALADWSKKYRGEYLQIVWHELLGGAVIHFRTTGERAISALGKDMDGESFDECAFEPHFEFIIDEVLHFRRLGTGGQLVLIGTMTEGITAFSDKWERGNPENPLREVDAVSMRMSTRLNIGFGIEQGMFDRLVASYPVHLIPQNIDGYAIESRESYFGAQTADAAFRADLEPLVPAKRNHRYAHGVDPALTFDSTWGVVIDASTRPATGVRVDRKDGRQTSLSVVALASDQHNAYATASSHCATGVDATGFGGKMFRDQLPFTAKMVEFGGTRGTKLRMLAALKQALEKGELILPRHGLWLVGRRQVLTYKLDDRKIEQDFVMALAVAWHMVRYAAGPSSPSVPFDYFAEDGGVGSPTSAMLVEMLKRAKAAQSGG
jgi:hypothetical protein